MRARPAHGNGTRRGHARDEKFSTERYKEDGVGDAPVGRCGGGQVGLGYCLLGGERRTAREGVEGKG